MQRKFYSLSLALGALLLAPLASFADDAPAAAAPAPAAPAPTTPTPKASNHLRGKISAVDADKKTVTVTQHKKDTTLTLTDKTKIYKADDAKGAPTGAFSDLTVGENISATVRGEDDLTAKEIHIRAPHAAKTLPVPAPAPATP